jgi:hypothetical protein
MKIRNSFVSNSSSSSFVVIGKSNYNDTLGDEYYLEVGKEGETQFDWGPDVIHGIYSRINFAYLQAYEYSNNEEWRKMLDEVIKDNSEITHIDCFLTPEYHTKGNIWGYIDHQSSAAEGENIEIFNDKETLRRFIFDSDSKIILDNDNH